MILGRAMNQEIVRLLSEIQELQSRNRSLQSEIEDIRGLSETAERPWPHAKLGRVPEDGQGGGGSLALGPIVEYQGGYAQFVGEWTYDVETQKWTFKKKNDTPAIVYEKQKIAIRNTVSEGSSSSDTLSIVEAPKLIKTTPSVWLKMTTTKIFKNFSYTPPADETGTGGMDAQSATISFLGSATDGATERILETVVEDANEQTTYEATETQAESEVV